jgi:hypothetical protein
MNYPEKIDSREKMDSREEKKMDYRGWLKSKHTEVTDILEQRASEVSGKFLNPKNVAEITDIFKEYLRARNDVEESKKQEFGHGLTYPNHPAPGEPYIVINDLIDKPQYREVLLRLFSDRISNSKLFQLVKNKSSATVRVRYVVGFDEKVKYNHDTNDYYYNDPRKGYEHPELVRFADNTLRRSGGSKTKKKWPRKNDKRRSRKNDKRRTRKNDKRRSRKNDKRRSRKNDKRRSRKNDKRRSRKNDKRRPRKNDKI